MPFDSWNVICPKNIHNLIRDLNFAESLRSLSIALTILGWLTVNPVGFWPQTHQPGGFEGRDKPGAQLVGFKQATTINTLKIGKNT